MTRPKRRNPPTRRKPGKRALLSKSKKRGNRLNLQNPKPVVAAAAVKTINRNKAKTVYIKTKQGRNKRRNKDN
jgi:hypothetical protein